MSRFHLDHLWEFLANIEPVIAMLWARAGRFHGRSGHPAVYALGAIQAAAHVHGHVASGPFAAWQATPPPWKS